MNYLNRIEQLKQFRESVYNVFTNGADALMNLIDALSSNTTAQSVVELSLNPAFERGYSALFKGIISFHQSPSTQQKKQYQKNNSKAATKKETTVKQPQAAALQKEAAVRTEATDKQPQATNSPQKAAEVTHKQPQAANSPQKAAEATHKQPQASQAASWPQKAAEVTHKLGQAANSPQKAAEVTHKQPQAANLPPQAGLSAEATHKPRQAANSSPQAADTQSDDPVTQTAPPQSKKQPPNQQQTPAQQQAPNQTYCDSTIDKSKQVQCPLKQPEAAKQPEMATKQPEALEQSELTVKEPPVASSDIYSKEDTVQILKDRQARSLLEHQLLRIVVPYLPQPAQRPFYLFGLDVTSQPRQFSPTLSDRGFVYHPNPIKGNKPVTIGHQYSLLAYLPEKTEFATAPWIVPLSTRRVATDQDKELLGMEQIKLLMDDKDLPFHNQLCARLRYII